MTTKKDWRAQSRALTLNHEVSEFVKTFKQNFVTLIISALGLVAALSWNDALRTWIDTLLPEKTVAYKFYAAIIVTILSITITYFLSKIKSK